MSTITLTVQPNPTLRRGARKDSVLFRRAVALTQAIAEYDAAANRIATYVVSEQSVEDRSAGLGVPLRYRIRFNTTKRNLIAAESDYLLSVPAYQRIVTL